MAAVQTALPTSQPILGTLQGMSGNAMMAKFEERMTALEFLVTRLNALNAMRPKKQSVA
jgi:hypothetical protein